MQYYWKGVLKKDGINRQDSKDHSKLTGFNYGTDLSKNKLSKIFWATRKIGFSKDWQELRSFLAQLESVLGRQD